MSSNFAFVNNKVVPNNYSAIKSEKDNKNNNDSKNIVNSCNNNLNKKNNSNSKNIKNKINANKNVLEKHGNLYSNIGETVLNHSNVKLNNKYNLRKNTFESPRNSKKSANRNIKNNHKESEFISNNIEICPVKSKNNVKNQKIINIHNSTRNVYNLNIEDGNNTILHNSNNNSNVLNNKIASINKFEYYVPKVSITEAQLHSPSSTTYTYKSFGSNYSKYSGNNNSIKAEDDLTKINKKIDIIKNDNSIQNNKSILSVKYSLATNLNNSGNFQSNENKTTNANNNNNTKSNDFKVKYKTEKCKFWDLYKECKYGDNVRSYKIVNLIKLNYI